ncbi:MAG: sigma-70 family RNA polymerase sigma factor, partial [Phycisphaerales bacterium]|nr:sigma-70 family RNA polymerase sigma factor [Phycisphaerales bacterium]
MQERTEHVTRILQAVRDGDSRASAELLPLVYNELRELAQHRMANEPAGLTLQATALVHEAYLRLLGKENDEPQWDSKGHFFAAAAEAMRRILVERARKYGRLKHGGGRKRVAFEDVATLSDRDTDSDALLALDEALQRLESINPRQARVVKLRHFAGLTIEETADTLSISPATVKLDWSLAKVW